MVDDQVEGQLSGLEDRLETLTGRVSVVSELAARSLPDRFARCEEKLDRLNDAVNLICRHLGIPTVAIAPAEDRPESSARDPAGMRQRSSSPLSPLPSSEERQPTEELRPEMEVTASGSANVAAPADAPAESTPAPVAVQSLPASSVMTVPEFTAPQPSGTGPAEIPDVEMAPPPPPLMLIPATPVNSQENMVPGPVSLPTSPLAEPIPGPSVSEVLPASEVNNLPASGPIPGPSISQTLDQVDTLPIAELIPGPTSSQTLAPSGGHSPATGSRSRTPRARTPAAVDSLGLAGPITRSRSRSRSPNPVAGEKRRAEDDTMEANKKSRVYVEMPPRT